MKLFRDWANRLDPNIEYGEDEFGPYITYKEENGSN